MKIKQEKETFNKPTYIEMISAIILIIACVTLILITLLSFNKTGTNALMAKMTLLITAILALTGIFIKLKNNKSNSLVPFTAFAVPLLFIVSLYSPIMWLNTLAPKTASNEYYCSYIFIIWFLAMLLFLLVYGRLLSRLFTFWVFGLLYIIFLLMNNIPDSKLIILVLNYSAISVDDATIQIFKSFYKSFQEAILCYIIFETAIQEYSNRSKIHHKDYEPKIESNTINSPTKGHSKLYLFNMATSVIAISALIVTHAKLKKSHHKKQKGH